MKHTHTHTHTYIYIYIVTDMFEVAKINSLGRQWHPRSNITANTTVECCYIICCSSYKGVSNITWYCTRFCRNWDQRLNPQKTTNTAPWRASYGVFVVNILDKIDSVITVPRCMEQLCMISFISELDDIGSTIANLPGCICPWNVFKNIRLNILPSEYFRWNSFSQPGYTTR